MIALAGTAFAWLMGTKAGRVMAMIVAGVLAILTFGWTMRRRGAAQARAQQLEIDNAAVTRATEAGAAAERDGAAKRLRDGSF